MQESLVEACISMYGHFVDIKLEALSDKLTQYLAGVLRGCLYYRNVAYITMTLPALHHTQDCIAAYQKNLVVGMPVIDFVTTSSPIAVHGRTIFHSWLLALSGVRAVDTCAMWCAQRY